MSLREQIMADVKSAMKNKETERLAALRFLQSAIKNREIEVRPKEIGEEDVLAVIKKSVKQRQDSIEQYKNAGRDDLVAKEQAELAIIEAYLPAQLPREQVEKLVEEAIAEVGATSMKDMGGVMKVVIAKSSGQADNKLVSDIVKSKLQ